jgi:hypothetical protein
LFIKDGVEFLELIFELSEFDFGFVGGLFGLTDLLDETLPLNFNTFDLFLECNDVLVKHLDLSLVI